MTDAAHQGKEDAPFSYKVKVRAYFGKPGHGEAFRRILRSLWDRQALEGRGREAALDSELQVARWKKDRCAYTPAMWRLTSSSPVW